MADRTLVVRVTGESSGLSSSFRKASTESKSFGENMHSHIVGGLHAVGRAAIYAGGILGVSYAAALTESVKAAADAQAETAKLRVAVTNAGISWQKQGKAIEDSQTKMSSLSGFMRSDLEASYANLITTTDNSKQALMLQSDAMDLSRARGMSLSQTSTILQKVWNGNTTSLTRLGILLPKITTAQAALTAKTGTATAKQIAAAKATDLVASRQAALAALQKKFGGQWKAYAGTGEGALARIRAAVQILAIKIGSALLPYLQRFSTWLVSNLPAISAGATVVFNGLTTAIQKGADVVQYAIGFYKRWSAEIIGVTAAVAIFIGLVEIVRGVTLAWAAAQAILDVALSANPIGIVIIAAAALAALFIVLWQRSSTFRSIVIGSFHAIQTAVGAVVAFISAHWRGLLLLMGPIGVLILVIIGHWRQLQSAAGAVIDFVKTHWRALLALIPGVGPVLSIVAEHFTTFRRIAYAALSVVESVLSRIGSWLNTIITAADNVASAISNIHMPSISFPHIPGTATGGIVTRPQVRLVGEAGPEAIIPLSHLHGGRGGLGGVTIIMPQGFMVGTTGQFANEVRKALASTVRAGNTIRPGGLALR